MRKNKFVLDCNIWISYFITGTEHKLIDLIIDNDLIIYSSDELLKEIERVLNYKHLSKYKISIKKALKLVRLSTSFIQLSQPIKRYIDTDSDDDYVIALALQTNSGFITSGDSDILNLKEQLEKKFKKLRILTKSEFEKMFEKKWY